MEFHEFIDMIDTFRHSGVLDIVEPFLPYSLLMNLMLIAVIYFYITSRMSGNFSKEEVTNLNVGLGVLLATVFGDLNRVSIIRHFHLDFFYNSLFGIYIVDVFVGTLLAIGLFIFVNVGFNSIRNSDKSNSI